MFGTLQKRLPQELRLAGITTGADANRFLEEVFWPAHNARFARPAEAAGSAFVAFAGNLTDILSLQEERVKNPNSGPRDRLRRDQAPACGQGTLGTADLTTSPQAQQHQQKRQFICRTGAWAGLRRGAPGSTRCWTCWRCSTRARDFTAKHFCEHGVTRSYNWLRTTLQAHGRIKPAPRRGAHRRKRPRRPVVGMMLHQDASSHAWVAGEMAESSEVIYIF